MEQISQGEILQLENGRMHVLVLSREFFNRSGLAVVCPVVEKTFEDALHTAVRTDSFSGIAQLEHLHSMDLNARYYRRVSVIPFAQMQDISDAVQGIFDYYPFSL